MLKLQGGTWYFKKPLVKNLSYFAYIEKQVVWWGISWFYISVRFILYISVYLLTEGLFFVCMPIITDFVETPKPSLIIMFRQQQKLNCRVVELIQDFRYKLL